MKCNCDEDTGRGRTAARGSITVCRCMLLVVFLLGVLVLARCSEEPTAAPEPSALPVTSGASREDGTQEVAIKEAGTPTRSLEEEKAAHIQAREAMVVQQIERRGVSDPAVLRAMLTVPRHRFVPEEYQTRAYNDHPLPIGFGQTISQPFIVAWMTELLELESDFRVLEIGTGSGYQAAVLGEIVAKVYTIEIIPELAIAAESRLQELGYGNIFVLRADGYWGWEEYAPFDAIIVTAAPDHVPQPLVQQLKDGAHLVIPIGPPGGYQSLWQFTKAGDELTAKEVSGVRFVPFTREQD